MSWRHSPWGALIAGCSILTVNAKEMTKKNGSPSLALTGNFYSKTRVTTRGCLLFRRELLRVFKWTFLATARRKEGSISASARLQSAIWIQSGSWTRKKVAWIKGKSRTIRFNPWSTSDPKMLAELLLKQIRSEGQQIREDIERHKQNYLSISSTNKSIPVAICKLCLQNEGAKVALIWQG